MRKIFLYRFGLAAILSCGIGFMATTIMANQNPEIASSQDLEGLKGPVHALDEVYKTRRQPPSIWV